MNKQAYEHLVGLTISKKAGIWDTLSHFQMSDLNLGNIARYYAPKSWFEWGNRSTSNVNTTAQTRSTKPNKKGVRAIKHYTNTRNSMTP